MGLKFERFYDLRNPKEWLTYPFEELWETFVDDSFDDFAIDIGEPNWHHGSDNEEPGQEINVARLLARPVRQHDLGQLCNSFPKQTVNIAASFFTPL